MTRRSADRLHRLFAAIPARWPSNVECHAVYTRRFDTPHAYVYDDQPPFTIDFKRPDGEDGDDVVCAMSAQYSAITHVATSKHQAIVDDQVTRAILMRELP